jgi:hypothetical protein
MVRVAILAAAVGATAAGTIAYAVAPGQTFQKGEKLTADALNARFDAVYDNAGLPVGSVLASALDEEAFSQVAPFGQVWVIADGKPKPGSKWAEVTGAPVPDLRGVYLRGQNFDRDSKTGNPESVTLGAYQSDLVGNHKHSLATGFGTGTAPAKGASAFAIDAPIYVASGGANSFDGAMNGSGGAETRPRSVVVNFFIRID